MQITLNKKSYPCFDEQLYKVVPHPEFNNLKIIPSIGILEREIGLLRDICTDLAQSITIITNDTYTSFIKENLKDIPEGDDILYIDGYQTDYTSYKIILSTQNEFLDNTFIYKYRLSNSNKTLYVKDEIHQKFLEHFHYYIKGDILEYDNMINLCIMVKNGGELFEKMLKENLHLVDRWTILDTGSTDNTIDIINKVLVGKKKGKLYQEPFINFRDSRNRCFELAGKTCKYNLMLDDTYVVRGKLREFLNTIRGDQFADSYSLLILSDDLEYYSNRITKSEYELKYIYRIHEVIQKENNVNVVIPKEHAWVDDLRADYMEKRTMDRKEYDLKLLFEELEENPDDPRTYYYIAQTYNLLEKHEEAAEYFKKRAFHPVTGFEQEKVDALFEMTRIYNFKLNRSWEECEQYYNLVHQWDPERPEASYFVGIHYLLENDRKKAFDYLKKAFLIGYPIHRQYSLKPTLSYYYTPVNLAQLCYEYEDFVTGQQCTSLFLEKNKESDDGNYKLMKDWNGIFVFLNRMAPKRQKPIVTVKPLLCFVADGGFKSWSGSSILKDGVGGSETYVIELSRYLSKLTNYQVIVFCNCEKDELFEGVQYKHTSEYFNYVSNYTIEHCFINRYSEYIPVAIKGNVNNIHIVLHDLDLTGSIIPMSPKIKNIYCLSEWHTELYKKQFPQFTNIIKPFHYGIDFNNFKYDGTPKIPHSFIYSSFPNRGLKVVLQMWTRIKEKYPDAVLNIFCNMNVDWCWNFHKQEMEETVKLLEEMKDKDVINHGWVDKKTLGNFWKQSYVWFYPCKFKETFCLTALEAAISKTLVISNDLAALKDTVGDRGLIIDGYDVDSQEWQDRAFETVCFYMDKEDYINRNYEWALTHSWEERAKDLATQLDILPSNMKFEEEENIARIKDVGVFYGYKNDYITEYIKKQGDWESELNNVFKKYLTKNVVALDIGAFIGTNTVKMAKYAKHVYAFEPFSQTFNLLKKNMVLNGLDNVTTINCAIGNENKAVYKMWYPYKDVNYGCMRINKDDTLLNEYINVNCNMIRLDNLDVFEPIGLIKIDVEGCETEVISGALDIINKYRPVIIIENWSNDVYKQLEDLDYECIQVSYCNYIYVSKLNYFNMYNWTNDIPTNSKSEFETILQNFREIDKCRILEIGTFTGTSIINMLKILPNAVGTTIDRWSNYVENIENKTIDILENMEKYNIEKIYKQNLKKMGVEHRVETLKGDSRDMLIKLVKEMREFDFIYVDGSHEAFDCYLDCELSWDLLVKGGIMGIDDYQYKLSEEDIIHKPFEGVNWFLEKHKNEYNLLVKNYRVFIQKTS